MAAVINPTSRLQPLNMRDIGFTAGVDQPNDELQVDLVVALEDQSMLAETYIEKTGATIKELDTRKRELESQGYKYGSEDAARIRMIENRPSNWKVHLTEFKGKYGELRKFIYGDFVDDGQVIREISPPHPRVWILGFGSATADTGGFGIEKDKKVIEQHFQSKYKKVEWKPWAEVMKLFPK